MGLQVPPSESDCTAHFVIYEQALAHPFVDSTIRNLAKIRHFRFCEEPLSGIDG